MTWQVGPTVLTCLWQVLTWHADATITSCWCHPGAFYCANDVIITVCWRHYYPGQPRGSGRLVFGSGQPIRAKKKHVTRGARLRAWTVTSSTREGVFDVRFRRGFHQWLRLFLLYIVVWSKHNFENFHFLAKNQTLLKPSALIPIVGESDRWCTDNCSTEGKHTNIIFNVVRQNRLHPRERSILLEIKKGYNKYMEEDCIHSTPISHCCNGSSSSFSLPLYCTHNSLTMLSLFGYLFIGKDGSSSINGCTWVAPLVNGWCNCQVLVL